MGAREHLLKAHDVAIGYAMACRTPSATAFEWSAPQPSADSEAKVLQRARVKAERRRANASDPQRLGTGKRWEVVRNTDKDSAKYRRQRYCHFKLNSCDRDIRRKSNACFHL